MIGHNTLQKVTVTIHIMAYGIPSDLVDDHLAMVERTSNLLLEELRKRNYQVIRGTILESTQWSRHEQAFGDERHEGLPAMRSSIECNIEGRNIVHPHGMDN